MSWSNYFEACTNNDIYAAFDALAEVGVLPIVNGEDRHGKLKRPMALKDEPWQKVSTDQWRNRLVGYLQNGVPVGIGCKPTGYVVVDIDPLGKDTRHLPQAWKEAAQLLFGSDDWPRTLVVKTEGGAHVWFEVTESIMRVWDRSGKKAIDLPSGGKIEIFVGLADAGSQVACAPSDGKRVSIPQAPIPLPESAEQAILREISRPERTKPELINHTGTTSTDFEWARLVLKNGHLDSQLADYDKWLAVGMALFHKFGEDGAELWEEWSARHEKHVDGECMVKVRSFKRTDDEKAIRFGTLIKIATGNGAKPPPKPGLEPFSPETFEGMKEAANTATIRALMKEREWLWGNKETNIGWFIQRGLHLVEGKEGTGKTRWILDLVRRWALDLKWPDASKPTIDPDAKVLFVASDSHWDQIATTAEAFGIPDESIIFTGPEDDPYNFTNLDDPKTLAMIRHWCDKYKVAMVVIDTLMAASARPLVDPQEVAQIAKPLRELARDKNVVVVMVGHLNSQGETWGRAMGRTCDNVIRLEAEEADQQNITIRSVKARWNRFQLPTIFGRQGECGWEYSCPGSDAGDARLKTASGRVADAIVGYLRKFPGSEPTQKTLVDAMVESGHADKTVYRVIKEMRAEGVILEIEKSTFSGKTIKVFDLPPD